MAKRRPKIEVRVESKDRKVHEEVRRCRERIIADKERRAQEEALRVK